MNPTERELDRLAHPAPAQTDQHGNRTHTPQPQPEDIVRNFGRPYEDQQ